MTSSSLWRASTALLVLVLGLALLALRPADTTVLRASFDQADLEDGWDVITRGRGSARVIAVPASDGGGSALQLTVPRSGPSSAAWLRGRLPEPLRSVTVSGTFSVSANGCSDSRPANPPLARLLDEAGRRVAGVLVADVECRPGGRGQLVVEHSGGYFGTRYSVRLDQWYDVALTSTAQPAQPATLLLTVGGEDVYQSLVASHTGRPFMAVVFGNEQPQQTSSLRLRHVRVARGTTSGANACQPSAQPAVRGHDVLMADGFEATGFHGWAAAAATGGASIGVQRTDGVAGRCALRILVPDRTAARASLEVAVPSRSGSVRADGLFRVAADGASDSNTPLLRLFAGDRRVADVGRQHVTGQVWLRTPRADGSWRYTSLGTSFSLGSWHRVSLRCVRRGTGLVFLASVDRGPQLAVTSEEVETPAVDRVMLGSEHFSQEMDLSVDDLVVRAS